jgi:hypothetical protein
MKSNIISLFLAFFVFGIMQAQLKVANILSDNMVLQRNTEVKIWGTAQPNQSVSVSTSWNKNKTKVVANENGEWIAKIKTFDVGGPYTIAITAAKEIIAKRLAYLSLGRTYGLKGMLFESPTFKSIQIADSVAIVSFDHAGLGLTSFRRDVACFEFAGKDSLYYPAQIKIVKEGLQVWTPQVKVPVMVRYAYSSFPKTNGFRYNTAGLPVLPFKSDNWLK